MLKLRTRLLFASAATELSACSSAPEHTLDINRDREADISICPFPA